MVAQRIAFLVSLAAVFGCEAVTGLKDLDFQPESCEPDPVDVVCEGAACGLRTDNCGQPVDCPDLCAPPFACAVGGVGPNECGCTGGLSHLTPIAPPGCGSFADVATGRTYYQCGSGSFDEGREICQSFGADLVVIKSLAENTVVHANMIDKSWLGLHDEDGCTPPEPCAFVWVDGTPVRAAFTNWNALEPNNSTGGEFCVEMHKAGPDAGEWNDITCPNLLNIVCETTCPDGT